VSGPRVSVIVPTRNRGGLLPGCLASFIGQSVPLEQFEILVIDNASIDDTSSIVAEFARRNPSRMIRYLYEPTPGLLSGRHRGAREARGEILSYVDDDILADRDWLRCVLESFDQPDVHLVGGPSIGRFERSEPSWMRHFYADVPEGRYLDSLSLIDLGTTVREVTAYFVWGLNYHIRKATLFEMGGFHPDSLPSALLRFRGDGEGGLSYKLMHAGRKTLYHPGARVEHIVPAARLEPSYFRKRRFLQGISDSYSEVRRLGGPAQIPFQQTPQGLEGERQGRDPEADRLVGEIQKAYTEGFNFHLHEVRLSKPLLDWVLRPDYLDDWSYPMELETDSDRLPDYLYP